MNHLNHMNTKRFLAAILGICAGMAVLLASDDFRASDFSRYLLASDDGTASAGAAAATSATSSAATSKGRVLQTEEPSRPMRILKVEEGTISDENRELIYLRPTTGTARSLKGATEGVSKDDVLRRVKEIMAHLDQNVAMDGHLRQSNAKMSAARARARAAMFECRNGGNPKSRR